MNDQITTEQPSAQPMPLPDWEWAFLEVFGHRSHAGRCREIEKFGAKMLRVDVPSFNPEPVLDATESRAADLAIVWTTHLYAGSAIFSYTPTDEASVVRANRPYARAAPRRLAAPVDEFAGADEVDLVDDDEDLED